MVAGSRHATVLLSRYSIDCLEPRRLLASIASTVVEGLGYLRPIVKPVPEMFVVDVDRANENYVSGGPEVVPGFQITIVYDESVDESLHSAFETARGKWESIITGDVPDVGPGPWSPTPIDDILIYAIQSSIDGAGNVLAQAGPFYTRDTSHLPINGAMQFDSSDVPALQNNGQLSQVVFHEMGHVLGIGSIWTDLGLISGSGTSNPVFTGTNALAEYRAYAGNPALTSVPLANTGGTGTLESHWRESTFSNEIMTGNINPGTNPISRITAASMMDLGYPAVNVDAAEGYNLPSGNNPAPVVSGLTDTPDPVITGSPFVLNALNVSDSNGVVADVKFYRESNGIPGLQSVGSVQHDTLVGSDTTSPWSATIDSTGLADGQYTYYARAIDQYNRVSIAVATSNTVISDPSLLPDAPSSPMLSASSDSGASNSDGITNDNTPTYSGTSEPGITVRLYANDIAIGTVFTVDGQWTITPSSPLIDGSYTITARAVNTIGEGPASPSSAITIDTIGPVITSSSFVYQTELAVTFTLASAPASALASDLVLTNQTTGVTIAAATAQIVGSAVKFKFNNNVIPNGRYQASIGGGMVDLAGNLPSGANSLDFFHVNGDISRNGSVNFTDLLIISQHYGQAGGWDEGDLNYDGIVNFSDLLIVSQNYGYVLP